MANKQQQKVELSINVAQMGAQNNSILYYKSQSVCVFVYVCLCVCMSVRNRLPNHGYCGDEALQVTQWV